MILKIILSVITFIASMIINLVTSIMPNNNIHASLGDIITTILTWTDQALNFCHFLFGDTMFIVLPVAIALLIAKYIALPMIVIFRSFLIKGNE